MIFSPPQTDTCTVSGMLGVLMVKPTYAPVQLEFNKEGLAVWTPHNAAPPQKHPGVEWVHADSMSLEDRCCSSLSASRGQVASGPAGTLSAII